MRTTFNFVFHFLLMIITSTNFTYAGNSFRNEEIKTGNGIFERTNELADELHATISGSASVCLNSPSPIITFTATGGTSPYTFTYQLNGVLQNALVTSDSNNSVTLSTATSTAGAFTYTLLSVKDKSGKSEVETGTETVTVNALPDLTLNSSAEFSIVDGRSFFKVCSNMLAELTFTNTSTTVSENANYTIDWGDGTSIFAANSWSFLWRRLMCY